MIKINTKIDRKSPFRWNTTSCNQYWKVANCTKLKISWWIMLGFIWTTFTFSWTVKFINTFAVAGYHSLTLTTDYVFFLCFLRRFCFCFLDWSISRIHPAMEMTTIHFHDSSGASSPSCRGILTTDHNWWMWSRSTSTIIRMFASCYLLQILYEIFIIIIAVWPLSLVRRNYICSIMYNLP